MPDTKRGFKQWHVPLLAIALIVIAALGISLWRVPETPFAKAIDLIKTGKAAIAVPILEELSRQTPDNPDVYPWLAQGYLTTGQLAEGRTALDTALRLKLPSNYLSPVVLAYANYYEGKRDFEEAEKLYQSASLACSESELNKARAKLYLKWAEDDDRRGLIDKCAAHLELATTLAKDLDDRLKRSIAHRLSQCYRALAELAEENKDDDEAIRLLNKSLSTSDDPATRMALAAIQARLGNYKEAIDNYTMVTCHDVNNLEAKHRLVDLLVETRDYSKAQQALVDLTEKEKSVENYQLMATVNLKLGNYAGAVRAYEDATVLAPKLELYKQLESVLLNWSFVLLKQRKIQESGSVKGHAERVAEKISLLTRELEKEDGKYEEDEAKPDWDPKVPPIALISSRNWLAKGSLTPEGEINIKNISGRPITDLTLTAVFYDNTKRRANGSVSLPVALPTSLPFPEGASRALYFSCPNIVKPDHQLAVIIFWKNRFLKEFPVVKQHRSKNL